MLKKTAEDLIFEEGWDIKNGKVTAFNQEFPITHPYSIYCKLYREETNSELKYQFLKKMHDYLWPHEVLTWNYWTEKRFRTYCEDYKFMSWASGGSTGKSYDAAKLAVLEYGCSPKTTGVIVVSTTLESLTGRVFGYIMNSVRESKLPFPFKTLQGNTLKIYADRGDLLHSISAIAAAKGKDNSAVKNYIGRHPKRKMLLILDEGPDLDPIIKDSIINLEAGDKGFQLLILGNSNSKNDLHGAFSTPEGGWGSVNPITDSEWKTTRKNGICLFFSCYNSPAIHETDPKKKKALSKFLITKEQIEEKKKEYGENSIDFWRMVFGFWRPDSTDDTIISKSFLDSFNPYQKTEWLGIYEKTYVAGLDPAFSTGGDACILRLAALGTNTQGNVVLDFRDSSLLFKIPISANSGESADIQIADYVIKILDRYKIPVHTLCVDATGQGRALGEVIKLRAKATKPPIKIYSTRVGNTQVNSFDVIVKSTHELWFTLRDFIQHNQIKGLDVITANQLTARLAINKIGGKPQLESKADFKKRMGAIQPSLAHSPDEADAAALALQAAIINYGFKPGQKRDLPKLSSWADEKFFIHQQHKIIEEEHKEKEFGLRSTFTGGMEVRKLKLFGN